MSETELDAAALRENPAGDAAASHFKVRPRVTDVAVQIIEEEDNEATWYGYAYPSSDGQPLGELFIASDSDVDEWIDRTDMEWPPEARAQLVSQLKPSKPEPRWYIENSPDLHVATLR